MCSYVVALVELSASISWYHLMICILDVFDSGKINIMIQNFCNMHHFDLFTPTIYRVLGILDCGAQLDATATFHRSCHMTRLLGERTAPFVLHKLIFFSIFYTFVK